MASPLTDLDELLLRCRDDKAKLYIAEAAASYRAGAFRAAVVATWIAVCFDIIDKLRELALSGDKEAEQQVEELEKTRQANNVAGALKFERGILELARDKFELISPLEFVDLDRLRDDRNRCAHPSLVSESEAYSPSAELARAHIHAAVFHLLQHPPAQGKAALERILKEVESDYFPQELAQAKAALSSGALRRPRLSLVRNTLIVLIKDLLVERSDFKRRLRLSAAVQAIAELHPGPHGQVLKASLSPLLRPIQDGDLHLAIHLFEAVPGAWEHLEQDVRLRLESYVEQLPSKRTEDLEFLLNFEPLKKAAHKRAARATREELKAALFFEVPAPLIDRHIDIYLTSASFDQANEWGKQLRFHLSDFQPEHARRLLMASGKNAQVRGSFEFETLINALRSRKILPVDEFEAILEAYGLEEFAAPKDSI